KIQLLVHLNSKRMRLSEIQNELMQRDVLFEENQNRSELSMLLQKNIDEKRNANSSPSENDIIMLDVSNFSYSDIIKNQYPLSKGWAIKGKQKYEKKGSESCIAKEVLDLLKGFFHIRNVDSSQSYLPEDILRALNEKANNNELERTKIPKIETIRNWIFRYSSVMKKEMAERMLVNISNNN
ncbi:8550_t:CDS:2, partial [Diversispora eburnea]